MNDKHKLLNKKRKETKFCKKMKKVIRLIQVQMRQLKVKIIIRKEKMKKRI